MKPHARAPASFSSPFLCIFGVCSVSGWNPLILYYILLAFLGYVLWHSWGHYSVQVFPFQSSQWPLPTGLTLILRGSPSRLLLKAGTAVSMWAISAHESRKGDTTTQDKPLASSRQQQEHNCYSVLHSRQKGTDSRNYPERPRSFILFVLLLASTLKHCTFWPQFI